MLKGVTNTWLCRHLRLDVSCYSGVSVHKSEILQTQRQIQMLLSEYKVYLCYPAFKDRHTIIAV